MDDEAGHESLLPLAAPSPAYPPGHTRHPSRPVPATVTVSVELQVLPAKATLLHTSQSSSDDDLDLPAERSHNSPQSLTKTMSRVPLLVRSSPAQGTGKLIIICDALYPLLSLRLFAPFRWAHTSNGAQDWPTALFPAARADRTARLIWRPAHSFVEP